MADRYLLESSGVDGYLLEDGSGVLLLEAAPAGGVPNALMMMGQGLAVAMFNQELIQEALEIMLEYGK